MLGARSTWWSICTICFAIVICVIGEAAFAADATLNLVQDSGIRGLDLGRRQSPPLVERDYADLAGYGANLVRIIIPLERCQNCPTYGVAAGEWEYMERTLEMGGKYGFKVILTFSPQPAGDKAIYWDRPELQASIADIWAKVARKFKGNPVVAGYELINEPVVPRDRNRPSFFGRLSKSIDGVVDGPDNNVDQWREFSTKLIQAIRNEDPESVIIFEPSPWAAARGFPSLTPLPFQRIVYCFHFYEPYALTHQGLYENHAVMPYPNEAWSRSRLSKEMEPVRAFARKYKVPIFVGEFSIVRWAPGDSAVRYLSDLIELFEAEKWNWMYHGFREYEGWDPELNSALPKGAKGIRSGNAPVIKLLMEQGFRKNSRFSFPQ